MSYILEALKKAQAERQLGSTPGIHDVLAPSATPAAARPTARYWIAGGVVFVLAGAYAASRMLTGAAVAPAPVAAPVAPAPVQLAKAEPAVPVVAPVAGPAVEPAKPAAVVTPPAATPQVEAPDAEAPPAKPPAPVAAETSADDSLPTLAELSPSVSGAIPKITLGGYIYSPVPAERLLLIDNNLRREGEEVATGLVLERLLPKAAVMNYRGTRFRMPF